MWSIYTVEYFPGIKNSDILLSMTTWMELEGNILREKRQAEIDKCCMFSVTSGL